MDFILNNQQIMVSMLSLVIVWIISLIWKKSADKAQIASALTQILDIIQDIANGAETRGLDNDVKKQMAVAKVTTALSGKKKKKGLVLKTFGTIGGAVEFVYRNRKWLFSAAGKLAKAVF
ncbi:MAG: hypothetical protein LHW64_06910 [Candidatus Cloacimonetes bacterium]|jgi:hypothetical protein|nr:hypothetical protein [Candidatus Cloacimonadota bacterium]MCB5287516.1 hypothetical protein [Candidatus Cloacimonadota bacterium]MCK9184398.1 hypothetical protein [Candidatus Cloacimonadota bacterium]MDY0229837.1 hypothetical protein [Candidatus Cloacimonadaceae bacterium]